jgi:TRAP-type C4-dicarboxylate transport system substrate-binding protein
VDAGKQQIALARAGLVEAGKPLLKEIEGFGVKIATLTPAEREQFVTATRPVYTKWKGTVGAPLVEKAEKALAGR